MKDGKMLKKMLKRVAYKNIAYKNKGAQANKTLWQR